MILTTPMSMFYESRDVNQYVWYSIGSYSFIFRLLQFQHTYIDTQTHKAQGHWAISADYKFIADAGQASGFADCRRKFMPRCSEPSSLTEFELDQF